jgi:hypothetical protein
MSKPGVPRPQDRLGPIRDLEFGEDCRDVVGHRLAAEAEPLGDLVVVVAGGDRGDGPGGLLLFGALEDVACLIALPGVG